MNGQSPEEPRYGLAYSDMNFDPSGQAVVDVFVECLLATSPEEREMMITYLRSKVCIECGAPDPNCPCWGAGRSDPFLTSRPLSAHARARWRKLRATTASFLLDF